MIDKGISTIKKYNMLENGDRVLLGVSGGADSIALLVFLNSLKEEYNLTFFVVHVNHGVRGAEAKRDEDYVVSVCQKFGIECKVIYKDMNKEARELGLSSEEAGRKIRYEAFNECVKKNNCNKIAVAHNLNDQAETIIMRLCRGTGLTGLKGIPAVRKNIIRPLIECSRGEIESYLEEKNVEFCTDSTNNETDYTRNKIRLELLPYMEKEINGSSVNNMAKTALLIGEEDEFIEEIANEVYKKVVEKEDENEVVLNARLLNESKAVIKRRVIRKAIMRLNKNIKNLTLAHVNFVIDLLEGGTGRQINLINKVVAKKEYEFLKFMVEKEDDKADFFYVLEEDVPVFIKEAGLYVEISKKMEKNRGNSQYVYTKAIDYDKIYDTLVLRNRQVYDTISINKNGGNKKIKNFFIDEKIPRQLRDKLPLLCVGSKVVWAIGYRCGATFVADSKTENILYVRVWEENQNDRKN